MRFERSLRPVGLATGVVAIVLALASAQSSGSESYHLQPESAIALAIVAYVFGRAAADSAR